MGGDVQGNPDADRPAAGTTRAGMTGRWGQMRQRTMAEVRLDEGKAAGSSPASIAPRHFGCQLVDCNRSSLPQRVGETQDHANGPGIGEMSDKLPLGQT
jgi:hypothetical protein